MVPSYLTKAYEWMLTKPDVVTRSWERAHVDHLNLLSAWMKETQDVAVELNSSRRLFPRHHEEESEVCRAEIEDAGEVSIEQLSKYVCSESTDLAIAFALQFDQ